MIIFSIFILLQTLQIPRFVYLPIYNPESQFSIPQDKQILTIKKPE